MWWLILTVTQWDLESLRRLTSERVCVYMRVFPESFASGKKTHPECGQRYHMTWGLRLNGKEKGVEHQHPSLSAPWLCMHSGKRWCSLVYSPPAAPPCCDGLSSLGLCWHFVTMMRKVAKTMGSLSTYLCLLYLFHPCFLFSRTEIFHPRLFFFLAAFVAFKWNCFNFLISFLDRL